VIRCNNLPRWSINDLLYTCSFRDEHGARFGRFGGASRREVTVRRIWLALGVVGGFVWGCGGAGGTNETTAGTGATGTGGSNGVTTSSSSGTIGGSSSGTTMGTGLPCDVAAVLQNHCWSCHGPTPTGGAPESLVTLADLSAPSKSNPSMSNAQLAVARMNDPVSPMPPKPAAMVPAAERATFETWVQAGLPAGDCNGGTGGSTSSSSGSSTSSSGGDPYNTPPICTSMTYWMGGDSGSSQMHPGRACRSCHVVGGKATGKTFDVGGTVYPTAHEPDDCNGVSLTGVQVIITDANGQDHPLDVNAAGNFYHQDFFGFAAFALPIRAKVVYNGQERVMQSPQMSGDCNSCHTEDGTNNAPGRIMLP
jgi:cytochrome c553